VGNFSDISWQEQVTLQLDYDDICSIAVNHKEQIPENN
jgi:hypothetical protein